MKVTGKVGKLRIMDSASIIANGSADNMSVFVYDDSGPSFTDKTTEASADDTGYTGTFWVDSPETVKAGTLLGKQIVAEIRLQLLPMVAKVAQRLAEVALGQYPGGCLAAEPLAQ